MSAIHILTDALLSPSLVILGVGQANQFDFAMLADRDLTTSTVIVTAINPTTNGNVNGQTIVTLPASDFLIFESIMILTCPSMRLACFGESLFLVFF